MRRLCCAKPSATQPKPQRMTSKAKRRKAWHRRTTPERKEKLVTNELERLQPGPATLGCRKIRIRIPPRKEANRKANYRACRGRRVAGLARPRLRQIGGTRHLLPSARVPRSAPVLDNFSRYLHIAARLVHMHRV
jgi:hypothetical protein